MENNINSVTPEKAREILWRKGNLLFKLDENQIELYNVYKKAYSKTVVWACSRRLGKSYSLCVIAIETCLKKKNAIVKMCAPKQKDIKTIIRPLMRQIIADAPEDIRPIEKASSGIWYFPSTGSQIQVAGCDNGRAESIRGGQADLCIIDEAGFVSKELEYIVNSILLPTTSTTKGKIILASTPPKSFDHEFRFFVVQAQKDNAFIKKTIFDNPRLTKEDIDLLAKAAGGYDSVNFRREYLAEFITDSQRAIIPEFTEELQKKIIKDWPRPPFYDWYVSMDVGMKDLTFVIFAYYDFKANKLIIEDEYIINGQQLTTQALAEGIKAKEQLLFTSVTGEQKPPLVRISDNNLILINDLYRLHGLVFHPTRKDDADAALNNMRILINNEQVIINPRCVNLIRHCTNGVWNKNKTDYERSGDDGHYDGIDALSYLIRNIDFTRNPYPLNYGALSSANAFHFNKPHAKADPWFKMLNMKKRTN